MRHIFSLISVLKRVKKKILNMIKTGIYKIQQLNKKNIKSFLGKLKNISITLYDQIIDEPEREKLAELILLSFSDDRGAYKRTYEKRFEEFDEHVINILKKIFKNNLLLTIHDVGVSDGRTALDFFAKISTEFVNIQYIASDYSPLIYVVEKEQLKVVFSHTGEILEIVYPPFVFNKIKRDGYLFYPINHMVRLFVEYFFVRFLADKYHKGLIAAKKILLFSPKVLQKAQDDHRFKLCQHDLLKLFDSSADVIRAMNVLNELYFSVEEFKLIIKNFYGNLKDGGVLIAGSNQDAGSQVHGGVYQKTVTGFKKIFQSGDGLFIEPFILGFKP
jgi:chemotaxis methyl-accepting protein methylase